MSLSLAGHYPPIPTAFDAAERLDLDHLAANLERWNSLPLAGIVMPGSNSEAGFLSREERLAVWQCCGAIMTKSGRRFIAGTGAETTAETIALTEAAAKAGAVATLVLPPFFYKQSLTHEALLAHYRALAAASPIPILVYNVPAFTGVEISSRLLIELAQEPQIIGAKDSSVSVVKLAEVLAERPDFQIFAGTGSAVLPFLSVGAAGSITALANVAAVAIAAIERAFVAGDLAEARRVQLAITALNGAITARHGVSGLKYTLDQLGYYGGPARKPLLPLSPAARAEIDRLLGDLAAQGFNLRLSAA